MQRIDKSKKGSKKINKIKGGKLDGRKLTHQYNEQIRVEAVRRVIDAKESPEVVIKSYGLHRSCIYKWLMQYRQEGKKSLLSTKANGPAKKLTIIQTQNLNKYLLKSPLDFKFKNGLWTVTSIVALVKMKFKINYSTVQVGRILKQIGFSRQRPIERAVQQNTAFVKNWSNPVHIKKK
ncbi:MAG: winged helix-turn-helix domain-containing protein [Phycisphaerales bacterium]|nr:winged helix-turn-helix domain-containing protein [Phycisphaerales bacterium]